MIFFPLINLVDVLVFFNVVGVGVAPVVKCPNDEKTSAAPPPPPKKPNGDDRVMSSAPNGELRVLLRE